MKQLSPAKLRNPLMRKSGTERGAGEFIEISWDEALDQLTGRPVAIHAMRGVSAHSNQPQAA